ncbi:hypothetical protein [Glaciecola petra]|uniref:PEP-CTERM sorting domain-containing protein n=1 Tax=Glaciecola petra TaxID=3075602 RepID=A0ABU2ZS05_9ALTE|nr:hypothetical protein [Aestuariibacter sp. P117]MDT0595405.1 hypothetical protein [Aestuariibacter sp. P117]
MNKIIGILLTAMIIVSNHVNASVITTLNGDDSVLVSITGFNAGSLGLVDIDFGGSSFNSAFGTDAAPAGYLFTNSSTEARAIMDSLSALLNDYNSLAATPISQIFDSVVSTASTTILRSRFNVGFNVNSFAMGHQRSFFNGGWNFNASTSSLGRNVGEPSFARMSAANTVSTPTILFLLTIGFSLICWRGRRSK